ncbi:thioesterase family protein [Actinosynnema sp. NPDC023587]|uniref:acyl-CoA thioesterase n=1 Tax=Actinosynnema sp. NPDC023587 TaxID=3154695 RepID=UPI0033ED12DA
MRTRIPFSDVDMHGNVHNGRYVAYAEDAVNEFLRESGLSDRFDPRSSELAYHVKKVEVVYQRPVGFDEVVDVTARVARVGRTSLTFEAEVRPLDGDGPAVRASVVWVCVDPATRSAVPVPDHVRDALTATTDPAATPAATSGGPAA